MCHKFCFFSLFCLDCLEDKREGLISGSYKSMEEKKEEEKPPAGLAKAVPALSWHARAVPERLIWEKAILNHTAFSILPRYSKHFMSNHEFQNPDTCQLYNMKDNKFQINFILKMFFSDETLKILLLSWCMRCHNTLPTQKWHHLFYNNSPTFYGSLIAWPFI